MAKKSRLIFPRRGEVYLVNFDPTIGAEIKKMRPALILQNDIANEHGAVTIVAAITSNINPPLYPTEVFIKYPEGGLKSDSVVLLNQIRSIDKSRLVRCLGKVESQTMRQVNQAVEISFGLIPI